MNALDFFDSIGLNERVRRWLRNNAGDELREEIIDAIMDAANDRCAPGHRMRIQPLIAKLHFHPTFK